MSLDPSTAVAGLIGVGVLAGSFIFMLWRWLLEPAQTPDPWDSSVEDELAAPESHELCLHCLAEQRPGAWFCPNCGSSTGPYNTLMPYLIIFVQAEALRYGTAESRRFSPVQILGFFFLSIPIMGLFAPAYWAALSVNIWRSRQVLSGARHAPPSSI